MVRTVVAALTLAVLATASPSAAQEMMIHSDLPLWNGRDDDNFYPKHFFDPDGSFGCVSNVALGDYRLTPDDAAGELAEPETWFRISNYGVMHCALVIREASTRADLESAPFEYFWIVKLWEQGHGDEKLEVLAFQQGAMGGSRYLLLQRQADQTNGPLTLLAPRCPREMVRDSGGIDIWLTRYCAVPDRPALRAIARDALRNDPVGILVRVDAQAEQ